MSDTTPTKPEDANASGFVASWDEVSAKLGTTPRAWVTYSKRPGFPAKTAQGYDLAALAAWKSANVGRGSTDDTLKALKADLIREQTALARLRREREERKTVSIDEVNELHRTMALKLRALLYSKLEGELPPKLAGCDALTIRLQCRALADELVGILSGEVDRWAE